MRLLAGPLPMHARLDLRGECSRCGLCCTKTTNQGDLLTCEHLRATVAVTGLSPLGTPGATRCAVYEGRRSGMPIRMLDGAGRVRELSRCFVNTWQEDHAIAPHLGRGCSLTVPVMEGQLVTFTPAPARGR